MSPFDAFVDDAASLAPHEVPVHEATAAFTSRRGDASLGASLGVFVVRDIDLPLLRGFGGPVAVAVTGGAGQVAGPAGLCARLGLDLVRLEITLRLLPLAGGAS